MGTRSSLVLALALVACGQTSARETAPVNDADSSAAPAATSDHPLGLAEGARWTFRGTWTRFDTDQNREITTPITWTTHVIASDTRGADVAWRIKGWPGDAPTAPDKQTRVVIAGSTVRLEGVGAWLTLPLRDGDRTCDPDLGYCWSVEASGTGHDIVLRTRPDITLYHVEPGRGITRFEYHHNGTTDDVVLDRVD